jgi:hypothetical protein
MQILETVVTRSAAPWKFELFKTFRTNVQGFTNSFDGQKMSTVYISFREESGYMVPFQVCGVDKDVQFWERTPEILWTVV